MDTDLDEIVVEDTGVFVEHYGLPILNPADRYFEEFKDFCYSQESCQTCKLRNSFIFSREDRCYKQFDIQKTLNANNFNIFDLKYQADQWLISVQNSASQIKLS